jgi:arylamine N-acetyltransferase
MGSYESTSPEQGSKGFVFSDKQLQQYLSHTWGSALGHRGTPSVESIRSMIKENPISTISKMQVLHVSSIPWGNVALHYSPHRSLSLSPTALLNKMCVRGLGGYCMETNLLFSTVLRTLRIRHYLTGARISNIVDMNGGDPLGFIGWEHMVIIATFNGKNHLIDVGFSNYGAQQPVPIEHGVEITGVPGLRGRLVYEELAESNMVPKQKMWIYQTCNDSHPQWANGYCFDPSMEFFERDFVNFNYRTHKDPQSWFTWRLVVTKVLLDSEGGVNGTLQLVGGNLSRRVGGGATEVIKDCVTEEDRVAALSEHFGINLLEEEKEGIRSSVTQLVPPPQH